MRYHIRLSRLLSAWQTGSGVSQKISLTITRPVFIAALLLLSHKTIANIATLNGAEGHNNRSTSANSSGGIQPGSIDHAMFSATSRKSATADVDQPNSASTGINHVVVVWFENHEVTQITQASAPTFAGLATTYANFTNYFGITHPSQPNYLDAFSGSNQGVTDSGHFSFPPSVDNLAKQLSTAGKSWRVFAQNFPSACFDGDLSSGGVDGPGAAGTYVRRHNPAMSFQSVTGDSAECANIHPLVDFDPNVNFAMVIPNLTNDMHDGTIAQGDAFLQQFIPLVTSSSDFTHTLLIVTFDEGITNANGGGHVYAAAVAPWLNNATIATTYNHFSLLRTIEEIFGLPYLGEAATARSITEILPPPCIAARIISQPGSRTACAGFSVSLAVTAAGEGMTFQWRRNGVPLSNGGVVSGANTRMLTINPIANGDAGSYDVVVSATCGSPATSTAATLTVNAAPVVSGNPADQVACEFGSATFTAAATGTPDPIAQWQVSTDGGASFDNIPSQTSSSLTLKMVSRSQSGNRYRAVFTNSCGTTNTTAGLLTVNGFSLSSSHQSFAGNGGTAGFNVIVAGGCTWTAVSSDMWVNVISGSGDGNGTVNYSVAANPGSAIRSAAIAIAGLTFTVYQGTDFHDVPPNHLFYNEIGKLSARAVTLSCGNGNYCPNDVVTRDQMAAFILRAKGEFNPPTPQTQRFADVPPESIFYNFIDRLAALQITLGCSPAHYCPHDPVLREQMSAYIMRGLGEVNPPAPESQRFTDVPPQNVFYNFIDRLAVLQFTMGCTPTMYCPAGQVTRGQMAAFLVRAFDL